MLAFLSLTNQLCYSEVRLHNVVTDYVHFFTATFWFPGFYMASSKFKMPLIFIVHYGILSTCSHPLPRMTLYKLGAVREAIILFHLT